MRAELRVPHGRRRTRRRAPAAGGARGHASSSRTTTRATRSTPRVGRGEGFAQAFPGETEGELDALRELFHRKALVARQSRLCEDLLAARRDARGGDRAPGRRPPTPTPDARRCLELREHLGIAADDAAPAFVLPDGAPIAAADLTRWMRMARLVRTSLEANGGICRSLLRVRYDINDPEEVAA